MAMRGLYSRELAVENGHLVQRRYDFYGDDTQGVNYVQHTGTIQAATSNTVTLAATASDSDDAYNGMGLRVDSGTGSGQDHQRITDYNGTTKVATLSADFTTALDGTSVVSVVDRGY